MYEEVPIPFSFQMPCSRFKHPTRALLLSKSYAVYIHVDEGEDGGVLRELSVKEISTVLSMLHIDNVLSSKWK